VRISTNYQQMMHTQEVTNALERVFKRSREVSTGVRLHNPSDDPFAASMVIGLKSALANTSQYLKNIGVVNTRLKATESALGEITDILNEVRQMVVAGANGTTEQTARDAYVQQITRIQERLVAIGNRELVPGQYLFAGKAVTTKPFEALGGVMTYNGSAETMDVEIRPGYIVQGSLVGEPLFTDIYSALETIKTDMSSGDQNRLGDDDLQLLDSLSRNVLNQRGDLGSLLQQIEATRVQLGEQSDELTRLISDYKDADMTEAIAAYQAAQTAYQAALAVAASALRMSLLDYIGS